MFVLTLEETQIAETELVQLAPAKLSSPADAKGSDINGGLKEAETDNGTLLQALVKSVSGIFD
jgi:hypothetical protein